MLLFHKIQKQLAFKKDTPDPKTNAKAILELKDEVEDLKHE